jgi:hypothetical protein
MNKLVACLGSITLVGFCAMFRHQLEADPVLHILAQLPILALSGWILATGFNLERYVSMPGVATALSLIAVFTILFWMLPRYIDAALTTPQIEAIKFLTVPLFIGVPLAMAWAKTHPFLRGFLKANALSMLGVLAFLYTHAPVRICNSYLIDDQQRLGLGFLLVAILLGLIWSLQLFFPPSRFDANSELAPQGEMP